jgi:hypothetical protein
MSKPLVCIALLFFELIYTPCHAQSIQIQAWLGTATATVPLKSLPYIGGGADIQSGVGSGSFAMTCSGTHQEFAGPVTQLSATGWMPVQAFGIQYAELSVTLVGVYCPNYPSTTGKIFAEMTCTFMQFKRPDGSVTNFASLTVIGYDHTTGQPLPGTVYISIGFVNVTGVFTFYVPPK